MKIVVFSINPIFPDVVTGGASKHLYHIAKFLGEQGHAIEILCTQSETIRSSFDWAKNVTVFPVLPFNLPFPQPYAISGADLALMVERISQALVKADRFYIHDGEFLVPDVYEQVPTIASFRDNLYPESVLGTFIGKFDDVICVSDYSAAVIEHTAGRFFPNLNRRIHRVNNGIDFDLFSPTSSNDLARTLAIDPEHDHIILHPHRPEPGKGLEEVIRVVDLLVNRYNYPGIKVLVPEWIDSMVSSGDSFFNAQMIALMDELNIRENFQFIPWLPNDQMPALYSLAQCTLSLGNIVEAFGNVAYESLACGTPSIVTRVGVHRTLLPESFIAKVDYGDRVSAAEQIVEILENEERTADTTLNFLRENFDFQKQIQLYTQIIENCQKRPRLQFVPPVNERTQRYILAPWCYLSEERIYHDFKGGYELVPQLAALLQEDGFVTKAQANESGVSDYSWEMWLEKTFLVPTKE